MHKFHTMTRLPHPKSYTATAITTTWVIITVAIAIYVTVGTDAFPLQRGRSFLPQSSSLQDVGNDTFNRDGMSSSFRHNTSTISTSRLHASRNSHKESHFNSLSKDVHGEVVRIGSETTCSGRKNDNQKWKDQNKWMLSTAATKFGVTSALFASILMAPITFDSMNPLPPNHNSYDIPNTKLAPFSFI